MQCFQCFSETGILDNPMIHVTLACLNVNLGALLKQAKMGGTMIKTYCYKKCK